jgi:hypothetical protein
MQTRKHNKRRNKLTNKSLGKPYKKGGGLTEEVEELKEKPSYMKHTLVMLGLSSSYIFFKLTKG